MTWSTKGLRAVVAVCIELRAIVAACARVIFTMVTVDAVHVVSRLPLTLVRSSFLVANKLDLLLKFDGKASIIFVRQCGDIDEPYVGCDFGELEKQLNHFEKRHVPRRRVVLVSPIFECLIFVIL